MIKLRFKIRVRFKVRVRDHKGRDRVGAVVRIRGRFPLSIQWRGSDRYLSGFRSATSCPRDHFYFEYILFKTWLLKDIFSLNLAYGNGCP